MKDQGESSSFYKLRASADFDRAHQKAFFRSILNKFQGKQTGLLSFEDIRRELEVNQQIDRGVKEVPVENIIGSVHRYAEFDEQFLPKLSRTRNRWVRIDSVRMAGGYLPPVDLYKLGQKYFVIDGNHRISVARQNGQDFIDAHIIELELDFPLDEEFDWNDIVLIQDKSAFYKKTELDKIRPEADINLTFAGQYTKLLEHIAVHRYYTGEYLNREISFEEAVVSWHDHIYQPMIQVIRSKMILGFFPGRTETDLYLWIIEHLEFLKKEYQRPVSFDEAVEIFSERTFLTRFQRRLKKYFHKILHFFSEKPQK